MTAGYLNGGSGAVPQIPDQGSAVQGDGGGDEEGECRGQVVLGVQDQHESATAARRLQGRATYHGTPGFTIRFRRGRVSLIDLSETRPRRDGSTN
jgi:hypothetical protein